MGQQKIAYERDLNPEQLAVVREGEGPCLVLAGAGSGKTRTLVYRVAWLVEHRVPPDRILLLTFTNKAAREMLSRVALLLKDEVKGLWGGTYHHMLLAEAALGEGFKGEVGSNTHDHEDKLVLSTIHQAKGLEWKMVFLIGLVDGHFPNARTLYREQELEEERRLFYVAVTRAKDELILTYPETSYLSQGYLLGRPSLFVRELPKSVYQRVVVESSQETTEEVVQLEETDKVGF